MTWNEYLATFEQILNGTSSNTIYDNKDYLEYVKLNKSRQNRWLKTIKFTEDQLKRIENIQPSCWTIITEAWCGDSAHVSPIIALIADNNKDIQLNIEERDSNQLIDKYLTNGTKSIPKVVIRNSEQQDILVFGPRPSSLTALIPEIKANNSPSEFKQAIQVWYNKNKGQDIINEILESLGV